MKHIVRVALAMGFFFFCAELSAEVKLKYFENLAVFPIDHVATDEDTKKALDDAWWALRENLTADKRFSVATQLLLISRGDFQPRQDLTVNEAVFLAQDVGAQVLITLSLRSQIFHFRAYWAVTGTLLWSSDAKLNVMKLEKDQIRDVALAEGKRFLDRVPFDGHQLGEIVRSNQITARILRREYNSNEQSPRVGDYVEWIDALQEKAGESFFEHPTIRVNARGRVEKIDASTAEVVVEALDNLSYLKEGSLIRFPRLVAKLEENAPVVDARTLAKKSEPKASSNVFLAAIFHVIGIILLAF